MHSGEDDKDAIEITYNPAKKPEDPFVQKSYADILRRSVKNVLSVAEPSPKLPEHL